MTYTNPPRPKTQGFREIDLSTLQQQEALQAWMSDRQAYKPGEVFGFGKLTFPDEYTDCGVGGFSTLSATRVPPLSAGFTRFVIQADVYANRPYVYGRTLHPFLHLGDIDEVEVLLTGQAGMAATVKLYVGPYRFSHIDEQVLVISDETRVYKAYAISLMFFELHDPNLAETEDSFDAC